MAAKALYVFTYNKYNFPLVGSRYAIAIVQLGRLGVFLAFRTQDKQPASPLHLDRLAPNRRDSLRYEEELQRLGARCWSCSRLLM